MSRFIFREVTADLWDDFETLFGKNGACGGCWCQVWRVPRGGRLWDETKGKKARRIMKGLFEKNQITGLLAYDGDRAVGWCSYGPRSAFPRLETIKAYQRSDTAGIWSITCFFIDKDYRGQGLARAMLQAAVKFMRYCGIRTVEAYPAPLTLDYRRLPAAFAWTGPLCIFENEGFEIIQRLSHSRPLVRKNL